MLQNVPWSADSFYLFPVTEYEVSKAINSLKNTNTVDCFNINTNMLKLTVDFLSPILTHLFNRCFTEGIFPEPLKIAKVTPVFKKGAKDNPENYRPITIIPMIGKVFEVIIKGRLCSFFEGRGLLCPEQFGFRSGRSTCDAVSALVGGVVEGFEGGMLTAALLYDLRKAFDCLCRESLLKKLERYGIRGVPLLLLSDYLRGRTQFVSVCENASSLELVPYGVPQGSVLGPLLFLIYINDLPRSVTSGRMVLFADDTTILVSGGDSDALERGLDSAQADITCWFSKNKLALNTNKTQKIIFSTNPHIYTGAFVNLLGVSVDDSLRWKEHVSQLCCKLSKQLYLLRQLCTILNRDVLISIYHAVFHSHITYCILIWGKSPYIEQAFRLQKKAVRIICNKRSRDSCRLLFKQLNILTLPAQYIYSLVLEIHKHRSTYLTHSDQHQYCTRYSSHLIAPALKLAISSRNIQDVKYYNRLPERVKNLNMYGFKTSVKTYLLENSFYSYKEYLDAPAW